MNSRQVVIIKGPRFEKVKQAGQQYIAEIIKKKIQKGEYQPVS